jgi:hypothetical protein
VKRRRPTVREGELHIYWGRENRHCGEDIIYHNGPGTGKPDLRLLHSVIGCQSQHLNLDAPLDSARVNWVTYEPSLLDQLEERGYDLSTLRFYIRKKAPAPWESVDTERRIGMAGESCLKRPARRKFSKFRG